MVKSRDDDPTAELKALATSPVVGEVAKNTCKQCNGNGVIATDSNIVTCPRCQGTKVEPNGNSG